MSRELLNAYNAKEMQDRKIISLTVRSNIEERKADSMAKDRKLDLVSRTKKNDAGAGSSEFGWLDHESSVGDSCTCAHSKFILFV